MPSMVVEEEEEEKEKLSTLVNKREMGIKTDFLKNI